jgi:sulfite reductase alpha subunit-like flavoprotein
LLTELLKQGQYQPVPVEDQVMAIFAATRGYLDGLDVDEVRRFERLLLKELHEHYPQIPQAILDTGDLSKETDKKLEQAIERFRGIYDRKKEAGELDAEDEEDEAGEAGEEAASQDKSEGADASAQGDDEKSEG